MVKLLLALRYLATGSFLMSVGNFTGVSNASACRFVWQVVTALTKLRACFIKFPTDVSSVRRQFFEVARFPRVIGAIDCTHIPIISPGGDNPEIFRNPKSRFSLNVQVVCDGDLRIQDIVARWPGSVHDQTVFINSRLYHLLESGHFGNDLILGDSGYANKDYLVTPLVNPQTPAEKLYNEAQTRTRSAVERCCRMLKSRFPVLRIGVNLKMLKVPYVIVACAILHNIAVEERDVGFESEGEEDDSDTNIEEETQHLTHTDHQRKALVQGYFQGLVS